MISSTLATVFNFGHSDYIPVGCGLFIQCDFNRKNDPRGRNLTYCTLSGAEDYTSASNHYSLLFWLQQRNDKRLKALGKPNMVQILKSLHMYRSMAPNKASLFSPNQQHKTS